MAINIGAVSIYQDIELSLTEHLVPPVVHVKQFDHMARKVRCALYNNAVESIRMSFGEGFEPLSDFSGGIYLQ